ncbi:MAG TPA: ABC transporter substrate-binding protein [Rhodoblastus sp.]|nr:ABC transporter substrate-binding protein [Rhodoblastus sp.]
MDTKTLARLTRREAMALAGAAGASAFADRFALAQGAPKRGGVLKIAANANPSSLDPATGGSGADHTMLFPMFDTLTEWDYETLKPKPGLAESWKYPDPQTLVLNLRSGVTFHDGTPLDADAVKFNLERAKTDTRSNIKADLVTVASVEATGPLQVTLKLSQPDTALPGILSDRAGMMVSPTALKAAGGNLDRKPVGAGAYAFVSWTDNEKLVVKRHDKYWRAGEPYPDGIEFAIIPESATALRSVIAGQNDLVYQLPARQKMMLQRASALKQASGPTVYCQQIYFNWSRPPFNDIRVRKALNHAVDRATFVKATLDGVGEPAFMNLPSSHWAYDADVAKLYPHDPDKARALLKEAGVPEGYVLELIGYTDQDSVRRAEILIEQFARVGLKAQFANGSIAEMSAAFFGKDKKGAGLVSAWTGRPDPSLTYTLMYSKDSYFNAGRADVPAELPDALKATRATENLEDRKKAFSKVQRIVMENALVCPLAFQFELDAHAAKVKGYKPNLLGKPKYEGVWLEG